MMPHSTIPEDAWLRTQFFDLRQKACDTWQELPTWGKCLAGGAATVAAFGSIYAINYLRSNDRFDSHAQSTHLTVEQGPLISLADLRIALAQDASAAQELLEYCLTDQSKVAVLKEVFQQIINEHYTEAEKAIVGNILQYRALFTSQDWFALWQYACDYEHEKNEFLLRDWIGEHLVDILWVDVTDTQTVMKAKDSGVKLTVPVIFSSMSQGDVSSPVEQTITFQQLLNAREQFAALNEKI